MLVQGHNCVGSQSHLKHFVSDHYHAKISGTSTNYSLVIDSLLTKTYCNFRGVGGAV